MKKALFLAALCLLSLSASYADNGLPKQWNFGDAVYGHEVQWNFDQVISLIGSGTSEAVASLTEQVATNEADITALQASVTANTAAIATNTATTATVNATIKKLTVPYTTLATQSAPFTWSDTGRTYLQLTANEIIRFRFDYTCINGAATAAKWGTIDGCVMYTLASGISFLPSASSLVTLDANTTDAALWSVIASCSADKLQFIASFPDTIRAYGTLTITGN